MNFGRSSFGTESNHRGEAEDAAAPAGIVVSGVLAICRPEHLVESTAAMREMAGVEIHFTDPRGRLVVTIEGSTTEDCAERLRAIQRLPHVLSAEMAMHVFEDERQS